MWLHHPRQVTLLHLKAVFLVSVKNPLIRVIYKLKTISLLIILVILLTISNLLVKVVILQLLIFLRFLVKIHHFRAMFPFLLKTVVLSAVDLPLPHKCLHLSAVPMSQERALHLLNIIILITKMKLMGHN